MYFVDSTFNSITLLVGRLRSVRACVPYNKYGVYVHTQREGERAREREQQPFFPRTFIRHSAAIPFNFHLSIQRTATTISHSERAIERPFQGIDGRTDATIRTKPTAHFHTKRDDLLPQKLS